MPFFQVWKVRIRLKELLMVLATTLGFGILDNVIEKRATVLIFHGHSGMMRD